MEDVQYILEEGQFIPESFAGRDLQLQENHLEDLTCEDTNQTVLVKNGQYYIPGQGVFEGHVSLGQLIISNEDYETEQDENVVHYMQTDENGQQILYKVSDEGNNQENMSNQVEELNKQVKLENEPIEDVVGFDFNIETEIDNIEIENSTKGRRNQFAILKDGKFYLQTYEADDLETLKSNLGEVSENVHVEAELQQQLEAFQQTLNEPMPDLSQITGKNLLTGETLSLQWDHSQGFYLLKNKNETDATDEAANKQEKKKTKKFVGKILEIKKAETDEPALEEDAALINKTNIFKMVVAQNDNETQVENEIIEEVTVETQFKTPIDDSLHDAAKADEDAEPFLVDNSGKLLVVVKDRRKKLDKENVEYVSKTLVGLMELASIQKKLLSKKLRVKLVEKSHKTPSRTVGYINGFIVATKNNETGQYRFEFVESVSDDTTEEDADHTRKVNSIEPGRGRKMLEKSITIVKTIDGLGAVSTRVTLVQNPQINNKHRVYQYDIIEEACEQNNDETTDLATAASEEILDETVPNRNEFPLYETETKPENQMETKVRLFKCKSNTSFPWKTFMCQMCKREFTRYSNLLRHLEIHVGKEKEFKCQVCGCSYSYSSSLTRHIVQNHLQIEEEQ